jgi:hypothetical protein
LNVEFDGVKKDVLAIRQDTTALATHSLEQTYGISLILERMTNMQASLDERVMSMDVPDSIADPAGPMIYGFRPVGCRQSELLSSAPAYPGDVSCVDTISEVELCSSPPTRSAEELRTQEEVQGKFKQAIWESALLSSLPVSPLKPPIPAPLEAITRTPKTKKEEETRLQFKLQVRKLFDVSSSETVTPRQQPLATLSTSDRRGLLFPRGQGIRDEFKRKVMEAASTSSP